MSEKLRQGKVTSQPRTGRLAKAGAREKVAARQAQAMDYRKAGASYRTIGAQLGISAMQAHRDCAAALAAVVAQRNESAEGYRAMELERLDSLNLAMWPLAMKGDAEAVRACVRIAERRARLLGLDAVVAAKLDIQSVAVVAQAGRREVSELTDAELLRRLQQASEMLGAQLAAPPAAPEPEPPATQEPDPAADYEAELQRRAAYAQVN